jgi:L-iditol 2-dehydrogenase
MKAAMLYGYKDLRIEEVEKPVANADEIAFKVMACGICPSDVRGYNRKGKLERPRIPGHESVGVVVEVGDGVEGVEVGDKIVRDWRNTCGVCYYCRKGLYNFCLKAETPEWRGFSGGFCEYSKATDPAYRKMPDNLSYEEAAFSEPLACCINGIHQSNIEVGDDVAIIGCGPIGLQLMQLAKVRGARIIAVDLKEDRLQVAKKLGAHDVINAGEQDTVETILGLTDGRGVNAAIVAVGHPVPIKNGLDVLDLDGTLNIFAGTYPKAEIPVDPNVPHYKHLKITGSHDFTPHDFTTALKLIDKGIVDVKSLISHRLPLEETKKGFDIVSNQEGLKVIIKPNE